MTGQEDKKPAKMARSSIACSRCRRSKVKCVNTGVSSICKACAQSNRECTYPPTGSLTTPKRTEPAAGNKVEGDGESKKRARKVEDTGRRNNFRTEDPLDAKALTRKVWDEVYDIFKLHFSTEMPFLHPPTFRNRMRHASVPRDPLVSAAELDGKVLLLGVLTLTARFHPELVAYHSPTNNPIASSEYYATALKTAFGPMGKLLTSPSLDAVQALLMLGLYEWGQTRGLSAWVYVGIAIRLAQSMGLAYEDDPENQASRIPAPVTLKDPRRASSSKHVATPREDAIEKEVRRRTLWSCFVMDRMLSAGKYRPTMMAVDTLRVQLPCSDDQFLFVHKVQTGFLNPAWSGSEMSLHAQNGVNDDGVLSSYIRLVEIFGRFSEWSYAGGRRTEKLPPWDPSTEFYKLRQELQSFHDDLPSNLKCTEVNLSAHIEKRNATTYASLHTLYSLCLIMLHREYIPFIPLRCQGPQGPLDEPTFPPDKHNVPSGFWEEGAENIFRAAKDIVDIVRTCQDNNALPESPQIGFAVWQAAFVSVYAVHFPHMDTRRYLIGQPVEGGTSNGDIRNRGYAGLPVKILGEMVPRLEMVKGYLRTIGKMHDYFLTVKHNFYNHIKQRPFGFDGGGLEEYKTIEKELKEFGSLEDAEINGRSEEPESLDQQSRASTHDTSPPTGSSGEPMQGIEAVALRPNGAWAAINASSPSLETEDRSKYPKGPMPYPPYQQSYHQSPNQNTNTPPLISPNRNDSNVSLPYSNTSHHQQPQKQQQEQLPYPISQQTPSQSPHASIYPSIMQLPHPQSQPPPQVSMSPPHSHPTAQIPIQAQVLPSMQQPWNKEADYEAWMGLQEAIRMNSGLDNYAQDAPPMEMWNSHVVAGGPANQSYLSAVWGPGPVPGPPAAGAWQ